MNTGESPGFSRGSGFNEEQAVKKAIEEFSGLCDGLSEEEYRAV